MNLTALGAVGPGIMQGQMAQQQLIAEQQANQARAIQAQQAARDVQAANWTQAPGALDTFNAQFPKTVPRGAPAMVAGPAPSSPAAPAGGGASAPPAFDPDAVWSAMKGVESSNTPGAIGPQTQYGRAQGIGQVLPKTAQAMAAKLGIPWQPQLMTGTTPEASDYQDKIGRAYFDEGMAANNGDVNKALMYYHGGPDTLQWGPKTHAYAQKVLANVGSSQPVDAAPPAPPGATPAMAATPPGQDAAATSGQPAPDTAHIVDAYDPMDAMRKTLQVAEFIKTQYKTQTGQDIGGRELLNQVKALTDASSAFTNQDKLLMQGAIAQLKTQTSADNTDKRVAASVQNTQTRSDTSSSNTDKRVAQSDTNNQRNNDTSARNTDVRTQAQLAAASMVDQRQRELASARNDLNFAIAHNRNVISAQNGFNAAQSRLASAKVQMGATDQPADGGIIAPPAPQYLDQRGNPVGAPAPAAAAPAPGVAATPKASGALLPPAAAKALKEGVPTTFANGQTWTLKAGKPSRVK